MPQANSITSSPRVTSPAGVGKHLAVLVRQDPRDLVAPLVHELADREHQLGALRQRGGAPGGERRTCRLDGRIDLLHAREVDGAGLLARRGVVDGAAPPGLAGDGPAADPMVDALRLGAGVGGCRCELGHAGVPPDVIGLSLPRVLPARSAAQRGPAYPDTSARAMSRDCPWTRPSAPWVRSDNSATFLPQPAWLPPSAAHCLKRGEWRCATSASISFGGPCARLPAAGEAVGFRHGDDRDEPAAR